MFKEGPGGYSIALPLVGQGEIQGGNGMIGLLHQCCLELFDGGVVHLFFKIRDTQIVVGFGKWITLVDRGAQVLDCRIKSLSLIFQNPKIPKCVRGKHTGGQLLQLLL